MAKHLTVGTIIEKNKIASENAFIILIDAQILDDDGLPVTTLSFCKNSEAILYQGVEYIATNFDFEVDVESGSEPSITLTAQDQTRFLQQYLEAYGGAVNSPITMTVVNTANINGLPEVQETFKIISVSVTEYVVTFELGTDAAVNRRFPPYKQNKDLCAWRYRSTRCGYTGNLPKCDYSLNGSNGCVAHQNQANFGAFPGINTSDQ